MLDAVEAGALGGGSAGSVGGRDPNDLFVVVDDRPLSSRLGGFTNSYRSLSSLQNLHQISQMNQQLINEATALVQKGEATAEVRVSVETVQCVCVCVFVCVCAGFHLSPFSIVRFFHCPNISSIGQLRIN
jgi:hypothetical protein